MQILRFVVPFVAIISLLGASAFADSIEVYFGTYTRGESKGIYHSTLNLKTGELSAPQLSVEAANPSFLAIDAAGKYLYSISEGGGGGVSSYSIDEKGTLSLIGTCSSGGAGPCHISLSKNGRFAAVANYGGGSVSSYQVNAEGILEGPVTTIQHEGSSVNPKRQSKPHAHSINFSPDSRFAYAADLGTDIVYVYRVDPVSGEMTLASEAQLPGGSGPRHFAFHPKKELAFLINEMTRDITSFRVNSETGELTRIASVSTLPEDAEATGSTAEVVAHPSGKFVYGSNRGHDSIVALLLDEENGMLSRIENEPIQGSTPRNFSITPDGDWLLAAGQKSNSVAVFAIDTETGALEYSGHSVEIGSPVCIRFVSPIR